MEIKYVDAQAIYPPPGGFVLSVLFLAAAVFVARRHPQALAPLWIFAFLSATAATVLWRHAQGSLRNAPFDVVAEALALSLFSTGATTLVLLLLTCPPGRYARLRWMVPLAVLAFAVGLFAGFETLVTLRG